MARPFEWHQIQRLIDQNEKTVYNGIRLQNSIKILLKRSSYYYLERKRSSYFDSRK